MFIEDPYACLTTPDECRQSMNSEMDKKGHFTKILLSSLISSNCAYLMILHTMVNPTYFSLNHSNDSITSAYVLAHDCSRDYGQRICLQPHGQHDHRAEQDQRTSA